jgi:hypothetical protein
MALGSTQLLTEMSTRYISRGLKAMRGADNLTALSVLIVLKSGSLNLMESSGPVYGLLSLLMGWWGRSTIAVHKRHVSALPHVYTPTVCNDGPRLIVKWLQPKAVCMFITGRS